MPMQVRLVSDSVPGAHGRSLPGLALSGRLHRLTLGDTHPGRDHGGRSDDGGADGSSDGEQDGAGGVHTPSVFPPQRPECWDLDAPALASARYTRRLIPGESAADARAAVMG
jgi:hypothetical protein